MELMLPASNSRTLMPLGITSVVATYIGRWALGLHPAFDIPSLAQPDTTIENVVNLLFFIPFGVLVGLFSVLFIKGIYWSEDFFEALPGTYYSRHSLGMLIQGLLIYLLMLFSGSDGHYGHYYVQGVGYATIKDVLSWRAATDASHAGSWEDQDDTGISNPPFCMLLFLAKFLSTNVTIGSGASGGIFSPSLFLGATLGGAWGHIISVVDPLGNAAAFDPIQACVAGMAGMVGGSTGASITAITMTFEMTRDYATILPIIITTVLAHMTRKAISEDSIYTLKLVRRGHVVPEGLQAAVHAAQRVQDVMTQEFRVVGKEDPMTQYDGVTLVLDEDHSQEFDRRETPRESFGAVCGPVLINYRMTFGNDLSAAEFTAASGDGERALVTVQKDDDLNEAIRRMIAVGAEALVVTSDTESVAVADVVGVVTKTGANLGLFPHFLWPCVTVFCRVFGLTLVHWQILARTFHPNLR